LKFDALKRTVLLRFEGVGDGDGLGNGDGVAVGDGLGVAVGAGVGVAVGKGVAVGDGVGVAEGVATGVDDGVGVGVEDEDETGFDESDLRYITRASKSLAERCDVLPCVSLMTCTLLAASAGLTWLPDMSGVTFDVPRRSICGLPFWMTVGLSRLT
jgi:hypothetical protein